MAFWRLGWEVRKIHIATRHVLDLHNNKKTMSKDTQAGGWEEVNAGGFVTFENEGDEAVGVITDYGVKKTAKGDANEYHIMMADGSKSFLASKGLHDKLQAAIFKYGIGNFVAKITYKEKIKTAGGNDFRVYEVLTRQKTDAVMKELGLDVVANSGNF